VYLNSYNDSAAAEAAIITMFVDESYSVVFAPVRASYPGVRAGMLNADETFPFGSHRQPLVIAAEGDLDYYGTANPDIPVDPSWITTSVLDHSDWAIYDIINQTLWNEFPGGEVLQYDLANGGCNITDFQYSSTYIPNDLVTVIRSYITQISSGTLIVTRTL